MNLFIYQLKQALLSLKKNLGFVFSVITTMGITLGALLCVLTLAYVMLIKPLPYPTEDQLVKVIYSQYNEKSVVMNHSFIHPAAIALYKALNHDKDKISLTALSFYTEEIISSDLNQPKINTLYTTPEWFHLLAPPMAFGRYFTEEHSLNHHTPGAVISFSMWKNEFNGQLDILNKKLLVNGVNHPVIGVIAESFYEPQLYKNGRSNQLWLPWDYNNSEFQQYWLLPDKNIVMFAKVPHTTNVKQINQLYSTVVSDYYKSQINDPSDVKHWTIKIDFMPLKAVFIEGNYYVLILLLSGVIGILLIAVSNITNLFIARSAILHRTIAINMALGANQLQVNMAIFLEAVLLLLISVLFALSISQLGFEVLQLAFTDQLPRVQELSLNAFTVVTVILIALCLAYFFVKLSIKTIDFSSLLQGLNSSGKGNAKQVSKVTRFWLIFSQITFSVVLVFSSAILIKDIIKQLQQPLGFNAENIMEMEFSVATLEPFGWDEYAPKAKELAKQLLALPEVAEVSFARTPLNDNFKYSVTDVKTSQKHYIFHRNVDHHYFNVMEQRILIGIGFSQQDISDQTQVAMINEAFSKQLATRHQDVIGRKILIDGSPPFVVIGVVKNLQLPTQRDIPARFYLTNYGTATYLLIRLKDNMTINRDKMIKMLTDIDHQFVLTRLDKLSDNIKAASHKHIIVATTAFVLVVLTLALSAIGLYGISSYSSKIRRFEIGTRLAIGAKRKDIISLVFKDNAAALLLGLMSGVVILLALYLGFSDSISDYISFALVPLLLFTLGSISLLSLFASYVPLRQFINSPVIHALKGKE
ncbi:MAG: putative permease [Alteromonadaceae bacterium]|jgi:predicted permease